MHRFFHLFIYLIICSFIYIFICLFISCTILFTRHNSFITITIFLGLGKYGDEGTDNKAKWGFMQKYYHKGVFYMDEDRFKILPSSCFICTFISILLSVSVSVSL